ncbi:MAG: replicative DNA helicase, partial [Muribaculaceae bacterium]|nr:replicative DNA helicase [Muribaculaceae bacterium]
MQDSRLTSDNRRRNSSARPADAIDLAGRKPPSDTATEAAVLGALLIAKDAYSLVCDILRPESFYDPRHVLIYQAIQALGAAQQPIDFITVINQLEKNETLEQAGGRAFIVSLTTNIGSAAHVEYHARIVMQKYLARELINFGAHVQSNAFDESNDIEEVMQEAETGIFELSQRNVKKEVTQIDPIIMQAVAQMEAAANRVSGLSGLESGYRELDALTSGWQNSDLIIIAARPAMGKTAFVLSMAKNMAVDYQLPIAIFTLEMANVQLVKRLISNVADLEGEKIKSGQLSEEEWDRLNSRLRQVFNAPLYL